MYIYGNECVHILLYIHIYMCVCVRIEYCLSTILSINDWLTAGISLADSVVILNDHSTLQHSTEELHEHMVDAAQIMATQKLAKLFPQVKILTEIHYRYNVRFMKTSSCEGLNMRNFKTMVCVGVCVLVSAF